ncbi:TRAF3-interacting protein 1 isoform X2 [Hemicordylus capensis]|uniref:TRAF3-interacting protein 1 isoform X2 n=1 Tax=Hemicordylus capensis TaxID=884348 RepID=UPI002302574B|nr:TRAF3-interacting protein 1 isoform X2 [Hemicordylus capensis]
MKCYPQLAKVIRSTGFMKGLYTDAEMKSDNVKDKDAKINYLQKAIDVVVMVTGEPLAVKPARIVAGHEPERTNELLQAIAKCCINKLSSDEAVQKVLAGEKADIKGKTTSSSKLQNRESKTEEHRSHKEGKGDTEIKDRSTIQDQKSKEEIKEEDRKQKESDKHKDYENRHKNLDKDNSKEGEKHEREKNKNRSSKQGRETEKNRDKEKGDGEGEKDTEHDKEKERKHEGREKDKLRERERERGRDREKEHEKVRERGKDREKDKRRERARDAEQSREQGKDKADKKATGSDDGVIKKPISVKDKAELDKESENSTRLSKQHSTKGPRQRAKPGGEGRKEASKSVSSGIIDRTASILKEKVEPVFTPQEPGELASDAEGDVLNSAAPEKIVASENSEIANELPPHIAQRKLPRPSSARPAPPRIKRQESTEVLLPERNGSAKIVTNVIIDKEEEDDDDQFVVEAAPQMTEMTEMATEAAVELEEDEKHGGLVKRILETKKDYELSQLPKSSEKEKPLLSEAARRKEKDLVSKEIEKFRGSIQALCRSALPLGKIMDYIQEDVDSMRNELQMWKNENKQLEEALQKEQGITDSVVEPLKVELAELDQLIRDEQDKICAKRANILKNDEKIQKMIHNINSRR